MTDNLNRKIKKYSLLLILAVFLPVLSYGDVIVGINNGNVSGIIKSFGKPTSLTSLQDKINEVQLSVFQYSDDKFCISEEGEVKLISFVSSRFSVFSGLIKGGFKVGDSYSGVLSKINSKYHVVEDFLKDGKSKAIVVGDDNDNFSDYPIIVWVENDIITAIYYEEKE